MPNLRKERWRGAAQLTAQSFGSHSKGPEATMARRQASKAAKVSAPKKGYKLVAVCKTLASRLIHQASLAVRLGFCRPPRRGIGLRTQVRAKTSLSQTGRRSARREGVRKPNRHCAVVEQVRRAVGLRRGHWCGLRAGIRTCRDETVLNAKRLRAQREARAVTTRAPPRSPPRAAHARTNRSRRTRRLPKDDGLRPPRHNQQHREQ